MDAPTNDKCLDELCKETKAEIRRALLVRRAPAHLIDDLIQEVFMELRSSLLEARDDVPRALRVAIGEGAKKARNMRRSGPYKWEVSESGEVRFEATSIPPTQEDLVLVSEVFHCGELSEVERQILHLAFFEGLTNKEIAQRFDKTEDAVSSLKYRAIKQAAAFVGANRSRGFERKKPLVRVPAAAGGMPATHRWSARLGSGLYGWSTAVDREGGLILVGWLQGSAVFGGAKLESGGAFPWKLWLVRVRRDREGAEVACLAGADEQHGLSITIQSDGHLIVAASFAGALSPAGEETLPSPGPGKISMMLAKIELASLTAVWTRTRPAGRAGQHDHSLVTDARGNIVVACLVPEPDGEDFSLIFRRFGPDGRVLKAWEYLHSGKFRGWSVAAAGSGLLVTGVFDGTIDFGPKHRKEHRTQEFFLAKLGESGECEWLNCYGSTEGQHGWSTCVNELGAVTLAGYFSGSIDFGNNPLKSRGRCDVFVARLDAAGKHVWSASYPGVRARRGGGRGRAQRGAARKDAEPSCALAAPLGLTIAPGPQGSLFLAGSFDPTQSFGAHPIADAVWGDLFLAKLGRDGSCLWCVAVGRGADTWFGNDIAVDAEGGVILSVYIQGSVTLGQQLHPANGNELDLCVVNFQ